MRHTKHEQHDEQHEDMPDILVGDRMSDIPKCSTKSNAKCS